MKSKTVLGHLAPQFVAQQENLATEALNFILQTHSAASRAFSKFIRQIGFDCPEGLRFETQRGGLEESIPDMKCYDARGALRLVIENKFWAPLTKNQPGTYLRELPAAPAALLFVVPEARVALVWDEIVKGCNAKEVSNFKTTPTMTSARISEWHYIAATSWRSLLDTLSSESPLTEEIDHRNDIAQLRGFCDMMDEKEILPLGGDEIIGRKITPLRIMNFTDLALAIVKEAASKPFCVRTGLQDSRFKYGSGAWVKIAGYRAWVGFDVLSWHLKGLSPIWVAFVSDAQMSRIQMGEVRQKLSSFRTSLPPGCFESEDGRLLTVPIRLLAEVERFQIIKHAVDQIRGLANELSETILEAGIEGGTVTLFGSKDAAGKWNFWTYTDETSFIELLSTEDRQGLGDLAKTGEPTNSFSEALSLLKYSWWGFIPLKIHPEFRAAIISEVQKRGAPEEIARWQNFASPLMRAEPSR
jgi:hypothetical protein